MEICSHKVQIKNMPLRQLPGTHSCRRYRSSLQAWIALVQGLQSASLSCESQHGKTPLFSDLDTLKYLLGKEEDPIHT